MFRRPWLGADLRPDPSTYTETEDLVHFKLQFGHSTVHQTSFLPLLLLNQTKPNHESVVHYSGPHIIIIQQFQG